MAIKKDSVKQSKKNNQNNASNNQNNIPVLEEREEVILEGISEKTLKKSKWTKGEKLALGFALGLVFVGVMLLILTIRYENINQSYLNEVSLNKLIFDNFIPYVTYQGGGNGMVVYDYNGTNYMMQCVYNQNIKSFVNASSCEAGIVIYNSNGTNSAKINWKGSA